MKTQRKMSADAPCAGAILESACVDLQNPCVKFVDSKPTENYGDNSKNKLSDIPTQLIGVSESAARHPRSAKHSSTRDHTGAARRSSSLAAPAAPCSRSTARTSKKLTRKKKFKSSNSKTSITSSGGAGPQHQRKCAEALPHTSSGAHKSTSSRSSYKRKLGFRRHKEETITENSTLVALRSPPPPLPPPPQRTHTEPPAPHTQHQQPPRPLAISQQYLASTSQHLFQRSQHAPYSHFPQTQNSHPTHYPSQGQQYINVHPYQPPLTHTQVPAHRTHLYEQSPNSKGVHHKHTAVESGIYFPRGGGGGGGVNPGHQSSSTAAYPSQHRRPSTAVCRTRAPAVSEQDQHLRVPPQSSLVHSQTTFTPHCQTTTATATRQPYRTSETTHHTSSTSTTGYTSVKRPSFFAPTHPDVHRLSAGGYPHPHPSHIYPSLHRSSVAQVAHATHTAFQQDHALTPSRAATAECPPWICAGHQHSLPEVRDTAGHVAPSSAGVYTTLAVCDEGSLPRATNTQGMGNWIGTSCSVQSRETNSRATQDPTEEDYFREWLIGPAIGSGGYSEVFRVHNRRDASLTKAAKRVEFQREADYEEFMHEAAIIKELGCHKHVLAIQGLIKGPRHGWMIFDLMEGDAYDMFTKNECNRALNLRKERMVADSVRQLLNGLIYCHAVGIVHFDIKPQNLLYKRVHPTTRGDGAAADQGAAGQPMYEWKLCDFNLARHRHNHPDGFYSQVYTLGYRAPEVIIAEHTKGRERYAEKAERYGVGATTFQMLTEFCAFESFLSPQTPDTDKDFIRCVLTKNLIECLDSHELLTLEARDFILRMMMFKPEDRMSLEEAREHPFVCRAHENSEKSPQPTSHSSQTSSHGTSSTQSQSPHENQNNQNIISHGQVVLLRSQQQAQQMQTSAPPSAPVGNTRMLQRKTASLSPEINLKGTYHKSKLRYLKEYHTRKLNL